MVEIDTIARRANTFWTHPAKLPVPFLLTQERTQVLDILTHLLSNSQDSIILCGPEGVGKTRLLEVLQGYEIPSCRFRQLKASKELNFDQFQEQIEKPLKEDRFSKSDRTFASVYEEKDFTFRKTVLIIDNAGVLAPGLSTEILHYADTTPSVSVVFVLTHDQLQLKYQSDQAIENCHIVELPPLTEKQCGEFMQHISAQASDGAGVNEAVVSEIYRHSHGLPSRIIAEYAGAPKKTEENPIRILVMAVFCLIAVALAVQWFSSRQNLTESKITAAGTAGSAKIDLDQPFLSLPVPESAHRLLNQDIHLDDGGKSPHWSNPVAKNDQPGSLQDSGTNFRSRVEPKVESAPIQETSRLPGSKSPESSEVLTPSDPPADSQSLAADEDDQEPETDASTWLSSQPEQHFSLQLMVLSKQQSIADVMNKYPSLKKDIRYLRRKVQNKEKFVLLYGSFPNAAAANKARQKLPPEFSKSMTRKIMAIRREFN